MRGHSRSRRSSSASPERDGEAVQVMEGKRVSVSPKPRLVRRAAAARPVPDLREARGTAREDFGATSTDVSCPFVVRVLGAAPGDRRATDLVRASYVSRGMIVEYARADVLVEVQQSLAFIRRHAHDDRVAAARSERGKLLRTARPPVLWSALAGAQFGETIAVGLREGIGLRRRESILHARIRIGRPAAVGRPETLEDRLGDAGAKARDELVALAEPTVRRVGAKRRVRWRRNARGRRRRRWGLDDDDDRHRRRGARLVGRASRRIRLWGGQRRATRRTRARGQKNEDEHPTMHGPHRYHVGSPCARARVDDSPGRRSDESALPGHERAETRGRVKFA